MKDAQEGYTRMDTLDFISHMVQMKADRRCPENRLWICFISHMVQMKAMGAMDNKKVPAELYIPHGSDESCLSAGLPCVF